MKYFLFYKLGRYKPDFMRCFKTMEALEKYIEQDIAALRRECPESKWRRSDYLVAERVK